MDSVMEGYRTRLRPGTADRYRAVHARIPGALAEALVECGLVSWRIWIDGETLFHAIETRSGKRAMIERMTARGVVDAEWDELISTLVDDGPGQSADLDPVWALSGATAPE